MIFKLLWTNYCVHNNCYGNIQTINDDTKIGENDTFSHAGILYLHLFNNNHFIKCY